MAKFQMGMVGSEPQSLQVVAAGKGTGGICLVALGDSQLSIKSVRKKVEA